MTRSGKARLSVAIAGCGYFAQFHHDAWSRLDNVDVVAVADPDEAKRNQAAQRFPGARLFPSAQEMLDAIETDAIDIITAPETHLDIVGAAARRKVDCICQKPLAPHWDDCVGLVELAERSGIRLIVHENFRFIPWFQECRKLLDGGRIGRPFNISFRLRPGDGKGPDAYLSRQPYFQKMPRFLIHETAIHYIDVLRFLFGEIVGVFARLKKLNPVIAGEDAGIVVFDFAGGQSGIFDGNRLVDHPAKNPRLTNGVLLIEGADGSIRLDGEARLFVRATGEPEREHNYVWGNEGYGGGCVFQQTQHAVRHLLAGTQAMNEGRAYLRNVEVEEAIYRSAQHERWIAVETRR